MLQRLQVTGRGEDLPFASIHKRSIPKPAELRQNTERQPPMPRSLRITDTPDAPSPVRGDIV